MSNFMKTTTYRLFTLVLALNAARFVHGSQITSPYNADSFLPPNKQGLTAKGKRPFITHVDAEIAYKKSISCTPAQPQGPHSAPQATGRHQTRIVDSLLLMVQQGKARTSNP